MSRPLIPRTRHRVEADGRFSDTCYVSCECAYCGKPIRYGQQVHGVYFTQRDELRERYYCSADCRSWFAEERRYDLQNSRPI
ncbi:MAG: hypothetical protein ACYC4U_10240 [Pirellulaceae bacterium]